MMEASKEICWLPTLLMNDFFGKRETAQKKKPTKKAFDTSRRRGKLISLGC